MWPVTATPVRTSMPRLANCRSTSLVMSSSQPGRILGSASRIVTLVPRSVIIDANSQPMAPPPITAAVGGSGCKESSSSEVRTNVPSTSNPGIVLGTEPDAMTTVSPSSSTSPDSPLDTVTRWPGPRVPRPSYMVTLRRLSSAGQPADELIDHLLLALLGHREVHGRLGRVDAELGRPSTARRIAAVSSSSLAGMQPTLRHVPPSRPFSTSAMDSPAEAP